MRAGFRPLVVSVVLSALAVPAMAQDRVFNFALRGGAEAAPAYPGSDTYEIRPDLGFRFGGLTWGRLSIGRGVGALPSNGLSLGGAFNVVPGRDAADYPELAGLQDVDTTVEVGLGLTYRQQNWLAFGELRQGIGGHEGLVGTLGADLIFQPSDRLTVTAGPRINFGDDDYAGTYFGVTGAEAAASGFGAYAADGGILGAGLQVQGSYALKNDWSLEGTLRYEKLQNSAADSPITQAGSEDQWRLSIGLSRSFSLNF